MTSSTAKATSILTTIPMAMNMAVGTEMEIERMGSIKETGFTILHGRDMRALALGIDVIDALELRDVQIA